MESTIPASAKRVWRTAGVFVLPCEWCRCEWVTGLHVWLDVRAVVYVLIFIL